MLSKEEVKNIIIKELELKNWFPDDDWDKVYEMLITDDSNANILDTSENLIAECRS